MSHNTKRKQFRFEINRLSANDGYDKIQWLLSQNVPWGTWRFTAHAVWINDDDEGRALAMGYKLQWED